jgi:cytochrome c biogenesis protein CcmG, thiol:disulfide interchange protein DsbE
MAGRPAHLGLALPTHLLRRVRSDVRCHPLLHAVLIAMLGKGVVSAQTPGDTAPSITLKTLAGGTDSLAGYRGHPVLVNFWATWCTPCRGEIPAIIAAYRGQEANGLVVLAINLTDQESSTKDVRRFVAEFQVPFPVLLDEKGKVRRRYALRGVPTSVFIGADGVVRAVNPGPITTEALQRHLAEIVTSPSPR